jgi:hypothetical protein
MTKDTSSITAVVPHFLKEVLLPVVCDRSTNPKHTTQHKMPMTRTYHRPGSAFLVTALASENSTGVPCLKNISNKRI